ncbi:secretin receptor-like [Ruditapes philippinarum]|uniref:secretin receptor-like n=1 Tax=Ruditapes philippinarum TaxID=129788 RepID=UPI00295B2A9A|nr:secretin receptor-like [Ruditapes philippinarum]
MCTIYRNIVLISLYSVIYGNKIISETGEVHISREEQDKAVYDEQVKCYHSILYDPYPPGVYCNRTWDNLACWPDTPAGSIVYQPCPNYIQGFYSLGNASKRCMPDGQWYVNPAKQINKTWTNYTQCLRSRETPAHVSNLLMVHIEYIQLMYNTGYGISFVSLLLAVFIMLKFRKLHCPRNTVHINLFISFILRAILSFLKDLLLVQGLGFSFDVEWTSTDTVLFIEDGTHWECKLLYTLFHYVLTANYMWILVEGLYLHTLVYVSVFSERGSVKWYYLLGWGTPLLSVIPWVIIRLTLENILCWNTNPTLGYFWVLKGPIALSTLINFIFFINILRALFTKLHKPSTSAARRNRYRRLAKATLILIPLFGVHYIVFIGVPENLNPTAEIVKLYFEMFFNSFQGFLVAVLLCFFNQEVQMEIRKSWYRLCSKPDPLYIQQAQLLVNSYDGARRPRESRSNLHSDKHMSSEGSSGMIDGCLCKWTLDKNGRLRCSFVKTAPLKSSRPKKNLLVHETKM